MASESFTGGCHCGRVRFCVRVERSGDDRLEAVDCNCSICTKKGFLHLIVTKDAFELLAGGAELSTYTFNTGVAKHTFCRVCGVHAFYTPRSHPDGVDVNVRCLDGDAMTLFTVRPFDGKHWEENIGTIR